MCFFIGRWSAFTGVCLFLLLLVTLRICIVRGVPSLRHTIATLKGAGIEIGVGIGIEYWWPWP